jgi:transposase
MVYVGVDLHRKRSHVVAVDVEGTPLLNRRIETDAGQFLRVFGELGPEPLEVAFEATYGWGWFADLLVDAGITAHMSHPLATKAIASARVKNDAIDARTLAHLLRTNLLPEAWIAPPEAREARRVVRMRTSLVRIRSRLKCQVHALLAEHGVPVGMRDLFGMAGRQLLADLRLPTISQGRVDASLRMIDMLSNEVLVADREIHSLFRDDPRLVRLTAIPRVGAVTAAVVIAEVWDVHRFPTADRLCSWAGLTPSERSSDAHTRRGHISKQGSRWLRWVMVEVAARPDVDPHFRAFYDRIASRRGRKIARVALARRVLTLCYYALRDEEGCRAFPLAE